MGDGGHHVRRGAKGGIAPSRPPAAPACRRCVCCVLPVDAWTKSAAVSSQGANLVFGEPESYVKYGERVLLQHVKTGSHITVRTSVHSESAPNCFAVDFGTGPQVSAGDRWFRILPKYKIRQEGDYIRLKDQVLFCFENAGWRYLSAAKGSGYQRTREVNCSPEQYAWLMQVCLPP